MFRTYNPGQGQLPMHLEDLVAADDLVRVVHEVVDRLDITEILDAIKARKKKSQYRGEPPYHPRLLLKILLYGYCTGTFSSRKLAAQTRTFVPMMWLAGTEHPDFRTISDFRKEHLEAIARLFVQVLQLAKALGMVKLGHVAVDGSKFKASASKHKNLSKETLKRQIPKLQEEVQRLLEEAEAADRAEDAEYGNSEGSTLPRELREKQVRLARMEQAMAELQAQVENGERSQRTDPEKQSINPTDKDSRIMTRRNGASIQSYNAQIAVDGDSGLIVGEGLSNNPIDAPHLIETLDDVEATIGQRPKKLSADTGFFSGDNLEVLEDRKIDGYIADAITETKLATNAYCKENFKYDAEKDAYLCPQGHWLPFYRQYLLPGGRVERRYRDAVLCKACPVREQCTKSKRGRVVAHDQHEPRRAIMRAKLRTPDGRKEYGKRKGIVEPVFGQIKQAMGYRQVSLRGLPKVRNEFRFVCSAFNLRKIAAKLREKPELWSVLLKWTGALRNQPAAVQA